MLVHLKFNVFYDMADKVYEAFEQQQKHPGQEGQTTEPLLDRVWCDAFLKSEVGNKLEYTKLTPIEWNTMYEEDVYHGELKDQFKRMKKYALDGVCLADLMKPEPPQPAGPPD